MRLYVLELKLEMSYSCKRGHKVEMCSSWSLRKVEKSYSFLVDLKDILRFLLTIDKVQLASYSIWHCNICSNIALAT